MKNRTKLPTPLIDGNVASISLRSGESVLVDVTDLELVQHEFWYAKRRLPYTTYATNGRIEMQRRIMGPPPQVGLEVDHINGNGLDNRRSNLRWATSAQNKVNSRPRNKFRGVSFHKQKNRWRAYICHQGHQIHLGYFDTDEEAARAYDVAASSLYGEFARPNFS